jgi:hypothetical protein
MGFSISHKTACCSFKEPLVKTLFHIILILCILTAQVGNTVALPKIPCADISSEQMAAHDMTQDSMSADCCEQECGCNMSVISLAMAVNETSSHRLVRRSLLIHSRDVDDINITLPQLKRPPKH